MCHTYWLHIFVLCMLELQSVSPCATETAPVTVAPTATPAPGTDEGGNWNLEAGFPCGKTVPTHGITGGSLATTGEFPWQVYITIRASSSAAIQCGGSIFLSRWIVTAAHCIKTSDAASYTVTAGTTSTSGSGQHPTVFKVVVHPQYGNSILYDIALIGLTGPLTYSSTVRPVCMVDSTQSESAYTGQTVTTAGYGYTSAGTVSSDLRKATMRLLSYSTCRQQWGSSYPSSALCATRITGEICDGDSGGPLTYLNPSSNVYQLFGVTSFGSTTCGQAPSGFTSLFTADLVDWIKTTVESTTLTPSLSSGLFTPLTLYICIFICI